MEAKVAAHSGIHMKGPVTLTLTTAFNFQEMSQEVGAALLLPSPVKGRLGKVSFDLLKLPENTFEVDWVELALCLLVHRPPTQF